MKTPSPSNITAAGLLLAVVVGAAIGVSAHTARYAEATSYLSSNPDTCINCHIMREQHEGWQKGAHHAVATCNDCHVPQDLIGKYTTKAAQGYRHSKAFTFDDFHEPIRITETDAQIVRDNCIRCHAELVSELVGHNETDCLHCHARVGHGR